MKDDIWDQLHSFNDDEENNIDKLFSKSEMCSFIKDAVERKHKVRIQDVEYSLGRFTFSIFTSDNKTLKFPRKWHPISFGNGVVTCEISLDDFQRLYHKLEERDVFDSMVVAVKRIFGQACEVVAVEDLDLENSALGGNYEVVVRMNKGRLLSLKQHWIPVLWIQDDLVAFEIDNNKLEELLNR